MHNKADTIDSSEILISVIIPVYNYAHVLPRCIDSVLSQLTDNVELIVIDDGSTDNTAQVLDTYVRRDGNRLTVVSQKNSGPAATRNRGAALSRGRYLLFLDADDELLPDALGVFLAALNNNPLPGMVVGGHVSASEDGQERIVKSKSLDRNSYKRLCQFLLTKQISISHGCAIFSKDLLLKRPYPDKLIGCEDIPVFAYMLISGPVVTVSEPLAKIHRHRDSLRNRRENQEEFIDLLVDETFLRLPNDLQPLRESFRAQRYLSLFRSAVLRKEKRQALSLYKTAFTISPRQSLRWSYLRKVLRAALL